MQECHHRAARARSVHLGTRLMGPLNVSGISHEAMPERVRLAPRKRAWSFPPPPPAPFPRILNLECPLSPVIPGASWSVRVAS